MCLFATEKWLTCYQKTFVPPLIFSFCLTHNYSSTRCGSINCNQSEEINWLQLLVHIKQSNRHTHTFPPFPLHTNRQKRTHRYWTNAHTHTHNKHSFIHTLYSYQYTHKINTQIATDVSVKPFPLSFVETSGWRIVLTIDIWLRREQKSIKTKSKVF